MALGHLRGIESCSHPRRSRASAEMLTNNLRTRLAGIVLRQRTRLAGTASRPVVTDLSTNGSSPSLSPLPWPPLPRSSHSSTFPPPPPQPTEEHPVWSDEVWASPLPSARRMFCNRSLNMRAIKAVGFDMDYTLASYKPETFETLAHDQTVDKLVKAFGYPAQLYDLTFDWRYMARGLVIDKKRGNILKVDRHKYVKLAHHGFRALPREERLAVYNDGDGAREFDEPDFALIDTLFSLAEAHLFMQLVELKDGQPGCLPEGKQYADLYRDVRGAVDLCHRDGSIKREVAKHPERYIHADPGLVPLLDSLRQAGKTLFLATNSLWDYTSVVMNWLIDGKKGGDRDDAWLSLFDVVMVGAGKPRFFTERKDLFQVHPGSGMLWNTEGGSPMIPIGEADLPSPLMGSTAPAHVDAEQDARSRVFQGGNYLDLHKMLGVSAGAQVLYVGDHIYGDVVRSKKAAGWRTMLVIPELESELATLGRCCGNMAELRVLRQQRDALEDQIQRLEWRMSNGCTLTVRYGYGSSAESSLDEADEEGRAGAVEVVEAVLAAAGGNVPYGGKDSSTAGNGTAAAAAAVDSTANGAALAGEGEEEEGEESDDEDAEAIADMLVNLREQRDGLRQRHRELLRAHHEAFHPVWGQLFKTGYQNSRYAYQVERFACLYTSHVSNMNYYSPLKSHRGRLDSMAHDDEGPCEL